MQKIQLNARVAPEVKTFAADVVRRTGLKEQDVVETALRFMFGSKDEIVCNKLAIIKAATDQILKGKKLSFNVGLTSTPHRKICGASRGHINGIVGVAGSIPVGSTKPKLHKLASGIDNNGSSAGGRDSALPRDSVSGHATDAGDGP